MFDLDLESMLFAFMLTYAIFCMLLLYALVGVFILVYHAACVLGRVLLSTVRRFFSFICSKLRTMPAQLKAYLLSKPTDYEAQRAVFAYLIVLAHHGRQP